MSTALKIRGIYATALTRLFLDHGFTVVDPSRVIEERLGMSAGGSTAREAEVEIEDLDGRQGVRLLGPPEAVRAASGLLRAVLPDAIFRFPDHDPDSDDAPGGIGGVERAEAADGGETLLRVEFPYLSKAVLDELRHRVVPTLRHHHRLKVIDSDAVERMEEELAGRPQCRAELGEELERRLVWDGYSPGRTLGFAHVKLSGRVIHLSPGEIVEADPREKRLRLKRTRFGARGRYDGLGVSRREGDYAFSEVREGWWFYHHDYHRRGGERIGSYFNVNTRLELYPDRIRYVDLEIDVVRWPDGRHRVIDQAELEHCLRAGYLSPEIKRRAEETAREIVISFRGGAGPAARDA